MLGTKRSRLWKLRTGAFVPFDERLQHGDDFALLAAWKPGGGFKKLTHSTASRYRFSGTRLAEYFFNRHPECCGHRQQKFHFADLPGAFPIHHIAVAGSDLPGKFTNGQSGLFAKLG